MWVLICALTCSIHVTNPTDMPSPGPSLKRHVNKQAGILVPRDRLLPTNLAISLLIKTEPGGYLVCRYKFNPPSSNSKLIVSDHRSNKNKELSHGLHPQFGTKIHRANTNNMNIHIHHQYTHSGTAEFTLSYKSSSVPNCNVWFSVSPIAGLFSLCGWVCVCVHSVVYCHHPPVNQTCRSVCVCVCEVCVCMRCVFNCVSLSLKSARLIAHPPCDIVDW